jgi:hypothetical protein
MALGGADKAKKKAQDNWRSRLGGAKAETFSLAMREISVDTDRLGLSMQPQTGAGDAIGLPFSTT